MRIRTESMRHHPLSYSMYRIDYLQYSNTKMKNMSSKEEIRQNFCPYGLCIKVGTNNKTISNISDDNEFQQKNKLGERENMGQLSDI